MATTIHSLNYRITANTHGFTRNLRTAHRSTSQFKSMLQSAAGLAGVAGFAGAMRSMVRTNIEFQKAMAKSTAIMGGLNEQLRKDMAATAKTVAKETSFSASQAAEAYFFLASAGMDAEQAIAAMPAVAKFATAGMFDLSLATDLLTDAQTALGMSSKDADQNLTNLVLISDTLVKANTLANASVQQFSEALTNKAAAAMRLVNMDLAQGVAVLAAFADQGIKGAEAGTAFGIVMRDLQTKAIKNKEAFGEKGIKVFDESGEMQNIADIIGDLEVALSGLSDEQKKVELLNLGFADKSVAYLQTLIGMSEKIREYEAALKDANGTTEMVADKTIPRAEKALNRFKGAWDAFATSDTVTKGIERAADSLDRFTGALESFQDRPETKGDLGKKGVGVVSGVGEFLLNEVFGHLATKSFKEKGTKFLRETEADFLGTGGDEVKKAVDDSANRQEHAVANMTGQVVAALDRVEVAAREGGTIAVELPPGSK